MERSIDINAFLTPVSVILTVAVIVMYCLPPAVVTIYVYYFHHRKIESASRFCRYSSTTTKI